MVYISKKMGEEVVVRASDSEGQMAKDQTLEDKFCLHLSLLQEKIKTLISGKTCPFPGSLPHGNWSCEMQEIPILGTSFLDEDAQSYRGKEFAKSSSFLAWKQG